MIFYKTISNICGGLAYQKVFGKTFNIEKAFK